MRLDRPVPVMLSFALGACAAAAVPLAARTGGEATILSLADAPRFVNPPGTAQIAHLARGENAYLGRLTMKAGAKVPSHRDATEELIHVLEGSGTITIDGRTSPVRAGDTIYMPAGAEVSFVNGDAPMVGVQVFAGPAPAAKYDAWSPGTLTP